MDCPRHNHRLIEKNHHSHVYDGCEKCGGYFIQKGLLHESLGHRHAGDASHINYAALPLSSIRCPADSEPMRALVFKGIEIDLCPVCEGVWLDSGEFEAITRQQTKKKEKNDSDESPDIDCSSGGGESSSSCSSDSGIDIDLDGVIEFVGDAVGSLFDGF